MPARKATARTKRRRGTTRKDRQPPQHLEPAQPDRPPWLGDLAAAHWDELAPRLLAAGYLSPLDQIPLALFCQTFEQYLLSLAAVRQLASHTAMTENGNIIQHPEVAVMNGQAKNLIILAKQLGMTPYVRGLRPRPSDPTGEAAHDELDQLEKECGIRNS